jgi:hypothetical protein
MTIPNITLHNLFDWVGAIVLVSSVLNALLPPYEWFAPWPRFQAGYKILSMTIARWGALNVKSLVYPSIKTNGTTPAPVP